MININLLKAKGVPQPCILMCQVINENNTRRETCIGHSFECIEIPGEIRINQCKCCGCNASDDYVCGYADAKKHNHTKNRPLTLKEAHDYGMLHPDEPLYIENSVPQQDNSGYVCASVMQIFEPNGQGSATYGVTWRCWLRKPSPEDIEAARTQSGD